MASPGRRADASLREQARTNRAHAGESAESIAAKDRKLAALYDAIRETGHPPRDLPDVQREALAANLPWLRSHLARDPERSARAVPPSIDVFVARGENDENVFPADIDALRTAFARGRRAHCARVDYPGLNHCFSPGTAGDLQSCADPEHGVSEALVGDASRFLSRAFFSN